MSFASGAGASSMGKRGVAPGREGGGTDMLAACVCVCVSLESMVNVQAGGLLLGGTHSVHRPGDGTERTDRQTRRKILGLGDWLLLSPIYVTV